MKVDLEQFPILKTIAKVANERQQTAYVIGGFVRDLLLKRENKDIDVVTLGSGIDFARDVAKALDVIKEVTVFKNFGTAMIKIGDLELEFVGARKESYMRDSRKPVVEEGTLEDDQNRRDFTINAMGISLNKADFGTLIDPFDGIGDLKRKLIKTPLKPAETFSDDPLRMLRAVRFASQLKFDIEPDTFFALGEMADRLDIISKERISTELNKIILSEQPSYGFKLLFHSKLLHQFFPEMIALHGVDKKDGKSHKDNFYHTLEVLDNVSIASDDLWLRWAAILHDIAKPNTKRFNNKVGWTFHGHEDVGARMVPKIFRSLKLPLNEKMRFVQKLVKLHLRPIALVKDEVSDSAVRRLLFEAGEDIDELMKLCRADITSKNYEKKSKFLRNFDKVEAKMREVEAKDQLRSFQPVITGEIIMKTFDLEPSRVIGEIKMMVREAILEGNIQNQIDEATEYMLEIGRKKGLNIRNNV